MPKKKYVFDDLKKYCYFAKEHDYIEVTEWSNGEGFDIDVNGKIIKLTHGELEGINYLIKKLEYDSDIEN